MKKTVVFKYKKQIDKLYTVNHPVDEFFGYANVQMQLIAMNLSGAAVSIDSAEKP
jgi:hypothetical protein